MSDTLVSIDTRRIRDWETFHAVFADAFGFPAFYGRNMDAWNDCMSSLDEPTHGMSKVHAPKGGIVVLQLEHVKDFKMRCPEQYAAIVECASFVNWRRVNSGDRAILALSSYA